MAKQNESVKLDELKSAPYNPRRIDEASKKALGKSIERFGDISGLVWNKTTGHLVCGHQRLDVLKKEYPDLKIEDNVIIAGDKRFPIRIVEWDKQTEKLANIAANSQYLAGEFDFVKLDDVIQDLKLTNLDDLKLLRIEDLIPAVNVEDYSDLDNELNDKAGMDEVYIHILIHQKYKAEIEDYLANGEQKTAAGFGKGLLIRCGLL